MYIEFKERNGSDIQAVSSTMIDNKQHESPNRFHVLIGESNSFYLAKEKEYNRHEQSDSSCFG